MTVLNSYPAMNGNTLFGNQQQDSSSVPQWLQSTVTFVYGLLLIFLVIAIIATFIMVFGIRKKLNKSM
jgi:type II secretory pathway component PulF